MLLKRFLVVLAFVLCANPIRLYATPLPKIVYVDPYWTFEHDPDATDEQKNAYYGQLDSLGITHVAATADSNTTNNGVGLIYSGVGGPYEIWRPQGAQWKLTDLLGYGVYAIQEAENEEGNAYAGYQFLHPIGGSTEEDPAASGGAYRKYAPPLSSGIALELSTGTYPRTFYRGQYKVLLSIARLRVADNSTSDIACVLRIRVGDREVALDTIRCNRFSADNTWQDFTYDYSYYPWWTMVIPQLEWPGLVELDIDRFVLASPPGLWALDTLSTATAVQTFNNWFSTINTSAHSHFMLHEFYPTENACGRWWNEQSAEALPGHPGIGVMNWFEEIFQHDVPTPHSEPFAYPFGRHLDSATSGAWNSVQEAYDVFTHDQAWHAGALEPFGTDRWFYVQVYGEWDCAADTVKMRDPQPNEIWAQAMLALAYGCRGIGYFCYPSLTCDPNAYFDPAVGLAQPTNMMSSNKSQPEMGKRGLVDWDWENRRYVPNYKYGVVQLLNAKLDSLWIVLEGLDWSSAGGGDSVGNILGSVLDSIRSTTFAGNPWVETGFFTDAQQHDYFMLVNRRSLAAETQTVRSWLNNSPGMYYVIDMYSHDTVLTGSLSDGSIPFTTALPPGDAKLFKIVPVGTSTVAGSNLPESWEGGIAVGGTITVDTNRTLTILGPAEIRVASGTGTYFKAYGPMTVSGSAASPVLFRSSNTSSPGTQDWAGIYHYGPGNLSFKHVTVQDAYRGIWVLNTSSADSLSIDSCEFKHGFYAGIQNDRDTATVVSVEGSCFSGLTYGIYVYRGRTEVDGCVFRGSMSRGITIEAGNARPTGGQIKNCDFDSLSATGIYLSMISSHSAPNGRILESNSFGDAWPGSNQTAINVVNCNDTNLVLYANVIDGVDGPFRPDYGIKTYSTRILIEGLYYESTVPAIDNAKHGIYCLSSGSSDPYYARVRRTKIQSGQYGVYVYSHSNVDLNSTESCDSVNAICVDNGYYIDTSQYNVWNASTDTVHAEYNRWNYCWWQPDSCTWMRFGGTGPVKTADHVRLTDPVEECGTGKRVAILSVDSAADVGLPASATLENYPNPFNSATVIQFDLPRAGDVQIFVFNVLGQRVRRLVDSYFQGGSHQANWDGLDDSGNRLASGVYFYRLAAGDLQISKKLVIVK